MAAPVVQNLQDIVAQIQAAYQPQQQLLDASVNQNDQSGQAQVAGLDAKKTQAFQGITQAANNRGMYFSGYTPHEEANYTSTSYLPALAQLQGTIAGTRNTLLGKKADLTSSGNTQAITVHEGQQSQLDEYNLEMQKEAAAAQAAELDYQHQVALAKLQASLTPASSSGSSGGSSSSSEASQKAADFAAANGYLSGKVGGDGYVSPQTYQAAKKSWLAAGYSTASFDSNFGAYKNPRNHNY